MKFSQGSMSIRNVLMIFLTALTLFPTVGPALLLVFTGELRLEIWMFAWVFSMVLFSLFFGVFASNILLKPLSVLRDELKKLANRQERLASLEIDAGSEHPIEVRTLRQAFANLLEALREENQKRGAFMATLVHDLKTPIIAANHALSAIEHNDALTRAERITLVKSIQLENEALLALVQKMVDANRFERDDVELLLEPTDLLGLAEHVLHRVSAQAKERGILLRLEGQGNALTASKELERALQNLLDNAIRYAQTEVVVQIETARVTVSNDGAGLPANLEQLCKPFNSERVKMAGREYTSGTGGLGLFIVSRIAELHGGALEHVPTQSGASLSIRLQSAGRGVS
jgi:signal transduction histidine kinase